MENQPPTQSSPHSGSETAGLRRALRFVLDGERFLWMGEANGVSTTSVAAKDVTLYVRPVLSPTERGLELIDDSGAVHAVAVVSR